MGIIVRTAAVGKGAEDFKAELLEIARREGVADRFSFFGPVPSDEVTAYAAGADLGVAPIENVCLSYYYCSPNKIFEYILSGLPVIASDFPEMSRVIRRFSLGEVFDPSDPRDIARAARAVLENPEQLRDMKRNTRAASETYNWENESRKLVQLYRSLR